MQDFKKKFTLIQTVLLGCIFLALVIGISTNGNTVQEQVEDLFTAGGRTSAAISGDTAVVGNVASDSADSGYPVKIGGYYASTTPTLDDYDRGDLQMDINSNAMTTLATQLAGEDLTNDVLKVEQRFNYDYVAAPAADTVVKATAGYLHAIVLGKWVTGGTVECSDHASDGDGNVKVFLTSGATDESGFPKTVPINAQFNTGITCDTIGSTQVTFIYR